MANTLGMNRQFRPIAVIVSALVVAALIIYGVFYLRSKPAALAPQTASTSQADEARRFIGKLQQSDHVDYGAAYKRAQQFAQDGKIADAELTYFFAARGGNGQAAFALAEINDPNYFKTKSSLLKEPAPFQAFKWYTVARQQGVNEAAQRLEQLHQWAEKAAQMGDEEAQHLLLEWK
ncbi:MAG TPA: hypothetical protein VFY39_08420 [Gammaproteobacteria bacterium]|nr:hypothetical protein [Gammaproteobacteria bacterium]